MDIHYSENEILIPDLFNINCATSEPKYDEAKEISFQYEFGGVLVYGNYFMHNDEEHFEINVGGNSDIHSNESPRLYDLVLCTCREMY